jgi:hypothetical protein
MIESVLPLRYKQRGAELLRCLLWLVEVAEPNVPAMGVPPAIAACRHAIM